MPANTHKFVNSAPTKFDSNCAVCEGKQRDSVHGALRQLTCCVCGSDAGIFQQHWNRDTGFGVCRKCVDWVRARGESEEQILADYGVEGVNYAAATGS